MTVITLLIAFLFPDSSWIRHALIANSVVGFLYTHIERDAIRNEGIGVLGRRVYIPDSVGPNAVNFVSHVLLPVIVLSRHRDKRPSVVPALAFHIGCLVLIDVHNTYPSSVHPITTYMNMHLFVFATSVLVN